MGLVVFPNIFPPIFQYTACMRTQQTLHEEATLKQEPLIYDIHIYTHIQVLSSVCT